jgi:Polyketide cyclase / dehydrase and lipid transport
MRCNSSLIGLLALLAAAGARAEIVSAGSNGFNIRHVVDAPNAAPPVVWAALSEVAKWWDPEHTYSGDARNLSLEPQVRGCFCEKLGLYAGIEHASVVYAQPAKTLRLNGALGPLQDYGVNGSMTWQIEPAGGGSRITLTYNVGGYADRPLSEWATIVDEVLGGQIQRLARLVTAGSPEAPKEGL